jgi:hypothetical protein
MAIRVLRADTCFEAELCVDQTWDGTPLPEPEYATVRLVARPSLGLEVFVDAPRYHDPLPAAPRGRLDGLWTHEVVELFLLGEDARYLELEVGPGGHYLALAFAGERVRVDDDVPVEVDVTAAETGGGSRWAARLVIPEGAVPPGWREGGRRANAFAIHGPAQARRYAVAHPLVTAQPDFHAIAAFPRLVPSAVAP